MPGQKRQPTKTTRGSVKNAPARGSARTAAARSTTAHRAAGAARKPAARTKSRSPLAPARHWGLGRLSIDRKLDILGVFLVLVGLLTLLSLFSAARSQVTGWWVLIVTRTAGMGSFVLPVALVVLGIWLVLRNVERLPMLSAERLTGVVLLYLNILAWMHLLTGGGWEDAALAKGGGYIGAFFEQLTTAALGEPGAYVVFSAWSLIAVALSLDISISEIFHFFQNILASLARRINQQIVSERAAQKIAAERQIQDQASRVPLLDARGQPIEPENGQPGGRSGISSDLPPNYHPLNAGPAASGAPLSGSAAASARGAGNPAPVIPGEIAPGAGVAVPAPGMGRSVARAARVPTEMARPAPLPPWKLPVLGDILETIGSERLDAYKEDEDPRKKIIVDTLASFGVPVKIVAVNHGPTVTQFGVEPQLIISHNAQGEEKKMRVRVAKIVTLADDLALALAAPRIRIQAPVPGRSYVGIEVPNSEISRVMLRDVMETEAFRKLKSPIRFALGKDVAGHPKCYDLAAMPHLLIAGTTGSGKSVCVNAILTCLLMNNSPTELRMILVDPKRVELTGYNGIPHLLAPVVVEAEEVVGALQWVQREMDARYHRFSQAGSRNIADYNARNSPPLPYMLVLIDELADLMMLAPDETERSLTRLAQLARATGIHLVIATQRPSVDVVTGLIKANFPARVAFAVASGTDSRVILDQPGAERLLGRGDMLFQAPDAAAPVRLQGVFVSDHESQTLVEYWRQQAYEMRDFNVHTTTATPVNMDMPLNAPLKQTPLFGDADGGRSGDPILPEAIKIVREEGKASISMLQRKLRIGYTRAARVVDQLEEQGIIGPAQPTSQVREVLDFGKPNEEV